MIIATWLTHFILFVTYFAIMVAALMFVPMALDRIQNKIKKETT